jgi:hypothetical protein
LRLVQHSLTTPLYRITDIKPLLAYPTNSQTPILTIALSHGFPQSLRSIARSKTKLGKQLASFAAMLLKMSSALIALELSKIAQYFSELN